MGKRKREPYVPPSEQTPDHALRIQQIELEKKLAHGTKRLNHVLKTARGFERQKLGKRIGAVKTESSSDAAAQTEKIARLEREVVAVKVLPHAPSDLTGFESRILIPCVESGSTLARGVALTQVDCKDKGGSDGAGPSCGLYTDYGGYEVR